MGTNQRRIEVVVGAFVLLGLICVGYLTIHLGELNLFETDSYRLRASFSNVGGLVEGSAVRISGVQVGQVRDIRLDQERFRVLVTFSVKKGIELSEDTMASIQTSGLIGDKYLSLSPGGMDRSLQPGDTIIDTQPPLNIQELVRKYVFGDAGSQE